MDFKDTTTDDQKRINQLILDLQELGIEVPKANKFGCSFTLTPNTPEEKSEAAAYRLKRCKELGIDPNTKSTDNIGPIEWKP